MTSKQHISAFERDQIGMFLSSGLSIRAIARKLGRSMSSIWLETKRNSINHEYFPIAAHKLSQDRNTNSRRKNALKDPEIYSCVINKLRCGWSPEQIAGRLRQHNHGQTIICLETIYRYIYSPKGKVENLREYLVRAQKKILAKFPYLARQTLTFDNGRENYNHQQLKRDLDINTYFCDSYSAWQKGANENHNGILRRYIPKKSGLTKLPQ